MKKILKNRVFIVIITTIIVASGTLYASNIYKSEEILYNTSDGKSMSVSEALNDLYSSKESAIKEYEFNTYNVTYNGSLTFSDTKWVKTNKETRKCTGSGDNQDCDFSYTGGPFETTLNDFKPTKILGGYVCFNVDNGIYDSGIRLRKGYNGIGETAYLTYSYYYALGDGLCVNLKPAKNTSYAHGVAGSFRSTVKYDNEKSPTYLGDGVESYVYEDGKVTFSFYVEQGSNYNGNYSSGYTESIYEIMGTTYKMSGKIYYE